MNRKQREKLISLMRGYHQKKLPIIPLHGKDAFTKKWSSHCQELPSHKQLEEYSSLLRNDENVTGFGLPLGSCSGLIAVDIDTEDERELTIIKDRLPESPIVKIGRKGETRFFKYNGEKSASIKNQAKQTVIEFLANGKQTVLPPSIHPQTQKPYYWKDKNVRLLNSDLLTLPTLPEGMINYFSNIFKGKEISQDINGVSSKSTSGRNEQLKSMAVAMLYEQKKGVKKIAEELVEYDRKIISHHYSQIRQNQRASYRMP